MADVSPHLMTLFTAALERPPGPERVAYLDGACGGDAALRAEVEALLAVSARAGGFLEGAVKDAERTIDLPPAAEAPGTVVGPYKLVEQIGEGGMGSVWMAQQTEPVKRLVAVKLIKPGMDSKQVLARFEAERQALALMDHPNIARVLDAGTTDAGRPYFVMDLVRGVPITKFCDDHHLTPRQRLELFIPVCLAIQHAHQKGIIHRDLKPSNVLVALYDGRPVPKVIDFGIAKAAGQLLTDKTLVTGFGAIVGTPEYMSPEQAEVNQLDIDTRSDVYSLGVLLYELLAGSPPFSRKDLEKAGMLEMLRVIREEEPSKPSTKLSTADGLPTLAANRGTEPAKLTRLVRGELDWIVMKALEKDRNRRYESANGFAADVQRYLADEPVLACPPSAGYRLRKFARRNKGGLAGAALVLLFLVLLGSGIGWAVRDRSAREAEAARQQAERLGRGAGHIESIFTEVDRFEDEQKWPEALAAARRAEAVVAGGEADAETAERVRARLKSLAFIDRLEQIRTERATLVDGKFDDVGADRKYARAFRDYGVDVDALAVEASIDRLKARPALAIPLAAALDDWVAARRFGGGQDTTDWKRLVAVARDLDPEPLRDHLRSRWGQPTTPESLADLRRLVASIGVRSQHPATLHQLANTLWRVQLHDLRVEVLRRAQLRHRSDFWINFSLAGALIRMGPRHNDEAISFLRVAVAVRPQSSAAHHNLGLVLSRQKRLDEAVVCFRTAIELDAKFARAHSNLAIALKDQKNLIDALAHARKAVELDPNDTWSHHNLGLVFAEQKDLDAAIACFKKTIDLDSKSATAHRNLALALQNQRKLDEAVTYYKKAIDLDPKDPVGHCYLGAALLEQGKLDEAVAAFREAIETDRTHVDAHIGLGTALYQQKKWDEAIAQYRTAIELDRTSALAHHNLGAVLFNRCELSDGYTRKVIDAYPNLAAKLPKLAEAAACYKKAIELDPKYVDAYVALGSALRYQGQLDEAIATLQKAIDLKPKGVAAWYERGLVYRDLQQPDKARADFAKVIELQPDHQDAWAQRHQTYQGQFDRAVADYTKDIERKPDNVIAWRWRAGAHAELKQLDRAVADYTKAIELKRDGSLLWSARASLHARLGQLEEAVADYSKAIELRPDLNHLWSARARLYLRLNQPEKAVAEYSKAIERRANDTELLMDRADLYRELKQWDKAVADWTVVVKREPGYGSSFAWLLATCPDPKFRDAARAVEVAKKAVESVPESGWAWTTLGVAHYRAGDWKAAVAALDKSMELSKGGGINDWFFLAMAHCRLNDKAEARKWYDKAVEWMDKNAPEDEGLRRFRAEASELLGVADRGRVEVAPAPHVKKK
jgi:tetratricopeptide (TPR) repeat protein